ncbi:Deoxycytidine monophosphate (dCMP) deaminase [Phlyctochytrium bullatum]|nr:Deoxycytidine monophosphate (dCMP) deaminase [Phlyctochytrium bullatum]
MLLGLTGPPCAGKRTLAAHLVAHHSYTLLHISASSESPSPSPSTLHFPTPDAALAHATTHHRLPFVILIPPTWSAATLDAFRMRPFFLLVKVDAPVGLRLDRWVKRSGAGDWREAVEAFLSAENTAAGLTGGGTLEDGMKALTLDGPAGSLYTPPDLHLLNHAPTLSALQLHLHTHPLPHLLPPLRPTWDTYFMRLTQHAAHRSNCMKRRVGCILAMHHRVLATGYNGTPVGVRNCNEGGCKRCNGGAKRGEGLEVCLCLHAEENALLEAGRERIAGGAVLYCSTCPCIGCAKKIVQSGVKRVVYAQEYSMDEMTRELFDEAGVEMVRYVEPPQYIVLGGDPPVPQAPQVPQVPQEE